MSNDITLKQSGRIMTVYPTAGGSLPDDLLQELKTALTFYQKGYSPREGVSYTERGLYIDTNGILTAGVGFLNRVSKVIKARNFTVSFSRPKFDSVAHSFDWSVLPDDWEFRHRQEECLFKMAGYPWGIIKAPTGIGKSTLIRLECQGYKKAKVLYVTKSTDVANGTYDELVKVIPLVSRVGGGGKAIPGARVVVCNADSIHKVGTDFDIVLVDEVHELATDNYIDQFYQFNKSKMFAFTASLKRPDGRHFELEGLFGSVIFEMDYKEAQANNMVAAMTVEWLIPNLTYDAGCMFGPGADRERGSVWRNDVRNACIADRVKKIPDNSQTLVVAKTVEHVYALKKLLPDFDVVYAPKSSDDERINNLIEEGLIPADAPQMTKQRRNKMREDFSSGKLKKVICNYVWSTGVDFKNLEVLVRADASGESTKNTQVPGRATRITENKKAGLVIDLWDTFSTHLLARSRDRKKEYESNGWHQIWPENRNTKVR